MDADKGTKEKGDHTVRVRGQCHNEMVVYQIIAAFLKVYNF